jgi:hypothetical protein
LREEHRLRVSENCVLGRIFGPKMEGEKSLRKLHNDELHGLYTSPNIVRVIKSKWMRCAAHVARMGEDNIKMDLRDIGIDGANLIRLAQDRARCRSFVSTVMDLRVPLRKQATVSQAG